MDETAGREQSVVKEREIIREIVKIRRPYCGNTYDEKENVCALFIAVERKSEKCRLKRNEPV